MRVNILSSKEKSNSIESYIGVLKSRVSYVAIRTAQRFLLYNQPNIGSTRNAPMWTGYFRANWKISCGMPDNSVIHPIREAIEPESSRNKWASESKYDKSEQKTMLDSHLKSFLGTKDKGVVYVTNGTWYARWLNNGGDSVKDYGYDTFKGIWDGNPFGGSIMENMVFKLQRDNIVDILAKQACSMFGSRSR